MPLAANLPQAVADNEVDGIRVPVWVENPYQLISWWDMEEFAAQTFYLIGRLIERLKLAHSRSDTPDQPVEETACIDLIAMIGAIRNYSRSIGLTLSVKHAERMIVDLHGGTMTNRALADALNELHHRIKDEMEDKMFFYVPPERAGFYLQPETDSDQNERNRETLQVRREKLFGTGVVGAFPSALFDFEEAGKCLALGRGTACVMHLSRVIEAGLKVLAVGELGLPDRTDWGKHLNDIETELTKRYKTAGARSPKELFYSEASAQIGHIKTAWRNPAMHVDRTYIEETAEEIFRAVRSFMRHLASGGLHE